MLDLKLPTDPRWADIAEKGIEDILVDHAYCEQKAANSCISLIVNFPEKKEMVDALAPIVSEEWGHFRMVLDELKKRGFELGRQRKDGYVNSLMQLVRKQEGRETQLLDRLLVNALIEARSCERFRLLWKGLQDQELSRFYNKLMISEAGHYQCFIDLANIYFPDTVVQMRWEELLSEEAIIISNLELRSDRIH